MTLDQNNRSTLPALVVQGRVVFPGVATPVPTGSARSKLAELVGQDRAQVILVMAKPGSTAATLDDFYPTALLGEVMQVTVTSGKQTALVRGLERRRLVGLTQVTPFLMAEVEPVISLATWAEAPEIRDCPAISDHAVATAMAIHANPKIADPILRRVAADLTICIPLGRYAAALPRTCLYHALC